MGGEFSAKEKRWVHALCVLTPPVFLFLGLRLLTGPDEKALGVNLLLAGTLLLWNLVLYALAGGFSFGGGKTSLLGIAVFYAVGFLFVGLVLWLWWMAIRLVVARLLKVEFATVKGDLL